MQTRSNIEARQLQIAVALDGMEAKRALHLAEKLRGKVWGWKLNDLLLREGVGFLGELHTLGGGIFCDAKLHDIPNTVANQTRVLAEAGADWISLHLAGGAAMCAAARKAVLAAAQESQRKPAQLVGISVLSAWDDTVCRALYGRSVVAQVKHFAQCALDWELDGLVCAARELPMLQRLDAEARLQRIVPGIRPDGTQHADHQRAATPCEAFHAGATMLVIGRPITAAADPLDACERIIAALQEPLISSPKPAARPSSSQTQPQ